MDAESRAPKTPRRRPRRGSSAWLAALLIVVLVAACGRKGDPMPPPSTVPAPASDLNLLQRGDEGLLEVGYPTTTLGGLALPGLERVEIWEAVRTIAFKGSPPEMPRGELLATGVEKLVLEGAELRSAVSGSRILVRMRLDPTTYGPASPPDGSEEEEDDDGETDEASPGEISTGEGEAETESAFGSGDANGDGPDTEGTDSGEPEIAPSILAEDGREGTRDEPDDLVSLEEEVELSPRNVYYYGVRFVSTDGKTSPFSNISWLAPEVPPEEPQQLSLSATADAVVLVWASDETEFSGFNVYRRFASERTYGQPIAVLPEGSRSHNDRTARFGNRYVYMVTTLRKTRPTVESGPSIEREIDYRDRFAPATVSGVAALSEAGRVRIVWQANEERDLAGYLIERLTPAGDFERLTEEPVVGLEYRDEGLAPGSEQSYRVLAVDEEGNVGPPGDVVRAVVP